MWETLLHAKTNPKERKTKPCHVPSLHRIFGATRHVPHPPQKTKFIPRLAGRDTKQSVTHMPVETLECRVSEISMCLSLLLIELVVKSIHLTFLNTSRGSHTTKIVRYCIPGLWACPLDRDEDDSLIISIKDRSWTIFPDEIKHLLKRPRNWNPWTPRAAKPTSPSGSQRQFFPRF